MSLLGRFWQSLVSDQPASRPGAGPATSLDDHIRSQVRDGDPGLAIAVVKAGVVVHRAGYGLANVRAGRPIKPETIFHLASCGKQFTALGILMLAEDGRLTLDDPVGRHLPALAAFGPQVTIRQLLQHTSGIRDLYDEAGTSELLRRCRPPTNADIVRTFAELGCPMSGRCLAGDMFSYSNSGYELLGSVIESASGQSYHDFFQTRVFDRLAMQDTFSTPDPRVNDPRRAVGYTRGALGRMVPCSGTELDGLVGSGSFYTTVDDLCRYALASIALISAASMRTALTSGRTNDGRDTGCGLGWYVGSEESGTFADHEGEWDGFYSYICRYLDRPLSLFLLSNNPGLQLVDIANVAVSVYR